MINNAAFAMAEALVKKAGYNNVKRWTEYKPSYTVIALEVYCSPILMNDNVERIRKILPDFKVTGNTNQSYILIQLL